MIGVFIADDHEIVRIGLRKLLENHENFCITGEAADGKILMEKLKSMAGETQILILDLAMPEINGVDALPLLQKLFPQIRILVLSGLSDKKIVKKVLQLGAMGYIHKNSFSKEILNALQEITQNRIYLSPSCSEPMEKPVPITLRDKKTGQKLSQREYEILLHLYQGKTGKEIAHEMAIKPPTVSTYKKRIFQKLKVQHLSELFQFLYLKDQKSQPDPKNNG